ncbi:hypothetical protein ES695_12390 [Candidatus Atribacteria bacterium 1244-E10-H5-B2]|nr:MAG: hypothetical protein ES695_12390 [Candidatus Atribacteria bacterium 1244-E10-H5-B2]
MKTGFIQAFVNLMKPVSYPYHGIIKPCYKQSDIPPYIGPDMKPPGEEWIIAWEGNLGTTWRGKKYIRFYDFLNSSDKDLCAGASPADKNVYYFAEVYLWQRDAGEGWNIIWADGVNCNRGVIGGYYLYLYKAWFNKKNYDSSNLITVYNTGPSSTGRVWKSLTGEYPGYYPFPQKEIIRV